MTIKDPLDRLDALVPPDPGVENRVLVDDTRLVRWAGPVFVLLSLLMVPWTVLLAVTLPDRERFAHYALSWTGFDLALAAALAATGYLTLRRGPGLAQAATATAVLLAVDAWFDVTSSRGSGLLTALVMAALVELPLAALCLWWSLHAQAVATRRVHLLLRRSGPRRPS